MTDNNPNRLMAYSKKAGKKLPMFGVTINKIPWNEGKNATYIAMGLTEDKIMKLSTPIGKAGAEKAFADGVASKGTGWD